MSNPTSAPLHIAYCTLGEHRGASRLWLEGRKVEDAGFLPSERYAAVLDAEAGSVRLVRRRDGDRAVSKRERPGRPATPIIDVCSAFIDKVLGRNVRARVVYRRDEIEISIHHYDRMAMERRAKVEGIRSSREVRIGSVCTGAGILDAAIHSGIEAAGLTPRPAFGVEIEARYQEAMLANNRALDGICSVLGSLDEIEPSILPEIDVLAGGLPCTAASLAGRAKKGAGVVERDEKVGHLVMAFIELVKASNPVAVVLENVVPYKGTASYFMAVAMLGRLGYSVRERDLHGTDFGSIERRVRMCLVAVDPSVEDGSEEGVFSNLLPEGLEAPRLGDVLEEVAPDADAWKDLTYLQVKEERDIAKGSGFRRQLVGPEDSVVGVIGRGYAKYRSSEPMIPHPTLENHARLLTPSEHAKVKGIDPALVAGLPSTVAHEVLGQSVVPAAFHAVASNLGRLFLGAAGGRAEAPSLPQGKEVQAAASKPSAEAYSKAPLRPRSEPLSDLPLFAVLAA